MDDKEKLHKVLNLVSEEEVRSWKEQLSGGRISEGSRSKMIGYLQYARNITSEFSDQTINHGFKVFNQSLLKLNLFLNTHFFREKNEFWFGLYPELRRDPEKSQFWHRHLQDVNKLSNKVVKTQILFLRTASITDSGGQPTTTAEKITIYYDKTGFLWKEPRKKFNYSFGRAGIRKKIFEYLIENRGFQTTQDIKNVTGSKGKNSISQAIGKLRRGVSNRLKLKEDIIEGERGPGYRLSGKYKIIPK